MFSAHRRACQTSFPAHRMNHSRNVRGSCRQLARQQQSLEARIQVEGIYSQPGNEDNLRKFDETNRLPKAHLAMTDLFEERGEIKKAIEAYEKAKGLDAEKQETYRALIRLYRDQGKLDQLCERWLARYRAKPNNEILKNHLVEALHKANRFEEASEILERE